MSNTLTVQDPDEGTAEVATETRTLLQAWADKHLPSDQDVTLKALADTQIKELREKGAGYLTEAQTYLERYNGMSFIPTSEFGKLMAVFAKATGMAAYDSALDIEGDARSSSHVFEGMVREFNKRFFQSGMKWNLHAEFLALLSVNAIRRTSNHQDTIWQLHTGTRSVYGAHPASQLGRRSHQEWATAWTNLAAETRARFASIADWAVGQAGIVVGSEGVDYWGTRVLGVAYAGAQIHYMDEDGPWVAGFLNLDDACRMRFRRVRLGAHLTEQGMTDGDVRDRVEKAKQQLAESTFEAYPNDTLWEDVYTGGPSSCMSNHHSDYSTFDNHHPVDAYSSAYYGSGDNSLCLIVSRGNQGDIIGRGILNLQRGTITRWYGDPIAERVLKRNGVKVTDRHCMEGSWLALIQSGRRFIHPYIDGEIAYGEIKGARVYIVDDSDCPCLQETSGSSYTGETHYCIDQEEEVAEDECEYQPISDNYISDRCDSWRCPIIDEYCNAPTPMTIHGVEVDVSYHVYCNKHQHFSVISGEGWYKNYSIDDESVRRAFFDEYGIEEDDDEEEAA